MSAAHRRLRLAASALLTLYLVLVGGVPVLHAMDAAPATTEAHYHGEESHCAPGHDEIHCAPCHFAFGTTTESASRIELRLLYDAILRAPHGARVHPYSAPSTPQSLPRAPPALR